MATVIITSTSLNVVSTLNLFLGTRVSINTETLGVAWQQNKQYRFELTEGFVKETGKNISPNPANANFFTFTTNATGPTIATTTPADNTTAATGNVNARLTITFNRNVKAGSGNVQVYQSGSPDVLLLNVPTSDALVSFVTNECRINVTGVIRASTSFYVRVDNGAITDRDGFAFTGINNATTFNFTTAASTNVLFRDLSANITGAFSPAVVAKANRRGTVVLNSAFSLVAIGGYRKFGQITTNVAFTLTATARQFKGPGIITMAAVSTATTVARKTARVNVSMQVVSAVSVYFIAIDVWQVSTFSGSIDTSTFSNQTWFAGGDPGGGQSYSFAFSSGTPGFATISEKVGGSLVERARFDDVVLNPQSVSFDSGTVAGDMGPNYNRNARFPGNRENYNFSNLEFGWSVATDAQGLHVAVLALQRQSSLSYGTYVRVYTREGTYDNEPNQNYIVNQNPPRTWAEKMSAVPTSIRAGAPKGQFGTELTRNWSTNFISYQSVPKQFPGFNSSNGNLIQTTPIENTNEARILMSGDGNAIRVYIKKTGQGQHWVAKKPTDQIASFVVPGLNRKRWVSISLQQGPGGGIVNASLGRYIAGNVGYHEDTFCFCVFSEITIGNQYETAQFSLTSAPGRIASNGVADYGSERLLVLSFAAINDSGTTAAVISFPQSGIGTSSFHLLHIFRYFKGVWQETNQIRLDNTPTNMLFIPPATGGQPDRILVISSSVNTYRIITFVR